MNSALILFVVCAAVIGAYAGDNSEKKAAIKQCAEEKGVSKEDMKAARHAEEITDKNIKCVYACVGKKMGTMNADGTLNNDMDKMGYPPDMKEKKKEKIQKKIEECIKSSADADECEAAYKMKKCMMPPKKND